MKEKLIINIHSFIDVITNSSTELFVFESEKTIYELQNLISLQEREWPSEYGYKVSVYEEDAEEYLKDEYNVYESVDKIVEYLTKLGYNITPPAEKQKCIVVSCERGCMNPLLKKWICETFNATIQDC